MPMYILTEIDASWKRQQERSIRRWLWAVPDIAPRLGLGCDRFLLRITIHGDILEERVYTFGELRERRAERERGSR
jgi:hypothetical protein